jgi:hypothetical protein
MTNTGPQIISGESTSLTYTATMRKILTSVLLLLASFVMANAQTHVADSGPSWSRLEGLPSGVGIHVKALHQTTNCSFKSATETELTCVNGSGVPQVFKRDDLKRVQLRHRGRSTLVGMAIGAGGGAAIGAPLGQSGSFVGHGAAAVIIAVPGTIIGGIVGALTDFTRSTIYRAP